MERIYAQKQTSNQNGINERALGPVDQYPGSAVQRLAEIGMRFAGLDDLLDEIDEVAPPDSGDNEEPFPDTPEAPEAGE